MAGFSNYLELEILDHIFKVGAYTQPANIYVALCKSTITDTHTGSTLPGQVSGGSYARKSRGTWDVASAGSTKNTGPITFAQATANWGTVTDFAVCDAITAGNVLCYAKLSAPKTIQSGDTAKFASGDLKITLD